MSLAIVIATFGLYLLLLSAIAWFADRATRRGSKFFRHPIIYAFSLAVYCTAWTFYGSIGRAATDGFSFLTIYIGPAIFAPIWIIVLRKIIIISKAQRITSIADFISARYGKSTFLGILATLMAVLSIIPYISIQLKAVASSINILTSYTVSNNPDSPFFHDPAMYTALSLAVFTIWFGTRKLDPNESHEGLVAAIAMESIFKLIAFLAAGFFVTFWMFDGFSDLFTQGAKLESVKNLLTIESTDIDSWEWIWLLILSMSAILLLPRQFHVAIVENHNPNAVKLASWLFPLYLFLINIFVIPIAVAGLIYFPDGSIEPDTFILNLPLQEENVWLALAIAVGGFSAATSMVIVAVIALSIMISNNLVIPSLVSTYTMRSQNVYDLPSRLLSIRRLSILAVLLLAYGYFKSVGQSYSLVSIGLISFTGIAQFLPVVIGGIYWKRGTQVGAVAGLTAGFLIWSFTLPFPTLIESGMVSSNIMEEGLFGWKFLLPYGLFGTSGMGEITHAAFWSLSFNTLAYVTGSLFSKPSPIEITQADIFVDIDRYENVSIGSEIIKRKAKVQDLVMLLKRFLGKRRAEKLITQFEESSNIKFSERKSADNEFINFTERHLSGAIGAAAAKTIIATISTQEPVKVADLLYILDQTRDAVKYGIALEQQSLELQATTEQLKTANEQLQELDRLKANFITTVTHEIRTPLTSIKALSKILYDHPEITPDQQRKYLDIVVQESERLSRLINQVLDLERIDSTGKGEFVQLDFGRIVQRSINSLRQTIENKGITLVIDMPLQIIFIEGNEDRIMQVCLNLLSNAIKFCSPERGEIRVRLVQFKDYAQLEVEDNGFGIPLEMQEHIFERFAQLDNEQNNKPHGSGLGLAITKSIVEQHEGFIKVESFPKEGACFFVKLPLSSVQVASVG